MSLAKTTNQLLMNKSVIDYDVTIIGGGYVGISAAYNLTKAGIKVLILEKESFLGGLGQAISLSNGTMCEKYYHHFFSHDTSLIQLINDLCAEPIIYKVSSMGIYSDGYIYSWNGLKDLFDNRLLSLSSKLRFCIASLLLAKGLLPNRFLEKSSLSRGLLKLYGPEAYNLIWHPMIYGKFGAGSDTTPLLWMHGRLKQRLESRSEGKELLGFIHGSLDGLTMKLVGELNDKNCKIELLADLNSVNIGKPHILTYAQSTGDLVTVHSDKILFATSANLSNKFIGSQVSSLWINENYYSAICIMIEMKERLSDYYWLNIADTDLYFCGYIEQTILTGLEEYNRANIAYLTKYIHPSEVDSIPKESHLEKLALRCLKTMFRDKFHENAIINMTVSIASKAQAVNDFKFKPNDPYLHRQKGIYLSNISHVYPDERSINNAIKIGNKVSSAILYDLQSF